ncbi:hypothetical protein ACTHGU_19940 [Chitinophagaceae bacterium MMS25-I14]
MNKTVRNLGLLALAAGVLYYPLMRLCRNMANASKEEDGKADHTEHHVLKMFAPAYRGTLKPHRRK